MSGLPIIAPINTAQLSARDMSGAMLQQPGGAAASSVRTITMDAVQQVQLADPASKVSQKIPPAPHDKRSRLVGPPPTFEVNVLQHMQETRMEPEVAQGLSLEPAEPSGTAEQEVVVFPEKKPAYDAYAQIGGRQEDAESASFDKSV